MTDTTEGAAPKTRAKAAPKMNIYQRISAISKDAGALAPASKNGVPFAFRGIDGTVAHLSPFLKEYEVITVPRVISHIITEREVGGTRLVKTTQVEVEYSFIGPDGDMVQAVTAGLADDFGDRSTAQAMSVAFRIALLQTFALPTHSVEPEESGQVVIDQRAAAAPAAQRAAQTAPQASGPGPLLAQAKVLGGKLGKSGGELNQMGTALAEGVAGWSENVDVLKKLVAALESELASA